VKKNCPACESELSRKWQSPFGANGHTTSQVLWSCGVCGAAFTRTQLQATAKPPAKPELLTSSAPAGSLAFAKTAPKIPID
jgi:transposase-like protein